MRVRVTLTDASLPTPEHLPRAAVAEPGEPVWVGRTPAATLCVPDDDALDDRHALVVCYADACRVFDASGRGLVVDDVVAGEALLRDGSVFQAGTTVARVDVVPDEPADLPAGDTLVGVAGDPGGDADPAEELADTEPEHVAAARTYFGRAPGPLYAILDAARRGPGVNWARASQELMAAIPDDVETLDYAGAAPYLVRLAPESPLLDRLLTVSWGLAECTFFASAAPFAELRAFLRALMDGHVDDGTAEGRRVIFRFYDPVVLARLLSQPGLDAARFFGPVRAWYVEEHAPQRAGAQDDGAPDAAGGAGEHDTGAEPADGEAWLTPDPDGVAEPSPPGVLLEFRPQRHVAGGSALGTAPAAAAVRVGAVRRAHDLARSGVRA